MARTITNEREELLIAVERDQAELRLALQQLSELARQKVAMARQSVAFGEVISDRPLPWLVGGFVLGAWLGLRGDGDEYGDG